STALAGDGGTLFEVGFSDGLFGAQAEVIGEGGDQYMAIPACLLQQLARQELALVDSQSGRGHQDSLAIKGAQAFEKTVAKPGQARLLGGSQPPGGQNEAGVGPAVPLGLGESREKLSGQHTSLVIVPAKVISPRLREVDADGRNARLMTLRCDQLAGGIVVLVFHQQVDFLGYQLLGVEEGFRKVELLVNAGDEVEAELARGRFHGSADLAVEARGSERGEADAKFATGWAERVSLTAGAAHYVASPFECVKQAERGAVGEAGAAGDFGDGEGFLLAVEGLQDVEDLRRRFYEVARFDAVLVHGNEDLWRACVAG